MKFPFIKQPDSKLCGPACLTSICRYYGKFIGLIFLFLLASYFYYIYHIPILMFVILTDLFK